MENQINPPMPNYREILQEIGRQLKNRKKVLIKRILTILWPIFVIIFLLYFMKDLARLFGGANFFYIFILWLVFSVIYIVIIRIIFHTEKIIWVNSYFDGKNIESRTSWHIAKKLFWPSAWLWIQLFIRFLLLPLLIIFILYSLEENILSLISKNLAGIIYFTGSLIILVYVYYYVRIKLRYIWFLFIDLYGADGFSYKRLFQEMKKLNAVNKQESFKKTLVVYFGSDLFNVIVRSISRNIGEGLGVFGGGGKLVGGLVEVVGKETSRQVTSLARITSNCILYRFARDYLYNEPQKINEYIYSL